MTLVGREIFFDVLSIKNYSRRVFDQNFAASRCVSLVRDHDTNFCVFRHEVKNSHEFNHRHDANRSTACLKVHKNKNNDFQGRDAGRSHSMG